MALLITTDGTKKEIAPADPKKGFTLAEVYALIGCETVQMVELRTEHGTMMLMNDEGKLNDLPVNAEATKLWGKKYNLSPEILLEDGDHIVGNVLLCFSKEFH